MNAASAGQLIREARRRAGMSQVALGSRAGVTQSVISAYESGARQPSLPVLERLVRAAGSELDISLRNLGDSTSERSGPVGRRIFQNRDKIRDVLSRHGLSNPRVFGSVARGEETVDSDLDILIDLGSGVGLLTLARCERDLEAMLGVRVDLVPAQDLKPAVASSVLTEARPL